MLSYRMTATQTATFDQGGHAATAIVTAIADILRVMIDQTVVVVDWKGLIAFVVEPQEMTA
jgi:hypothetical protein